VGVQPAELLAALAVVPEREGRLVLLVGGEPLLRPDVLRLLAAIRASGCVPGIVTTGRPLVYPQMRERLRRAGVAYVRIQLFGVGPAHDRATAVVGAFEQAMNGVRAWLAEAGADADVDVALTVRGAEPVSVPSDVEAIAREINSPTVQIVVSVDPSAAAAGDHDALRRAIAPLADWNDEASRPLLAWEGVPPSASPLSLLTAPPLRPAFLAGTPRASCLGKTVARTARSVEALPPPQANSFNFVRTATSVSYGASAADCTAHAAAPDRDPARHLWLIEDDRLILCATDTHDFDAAGIARVKDEWSHIFVDRSPAGVLDDISEGMRRVFPDATCDACANRSHCARRFRVVEGAPFAREEEWIERHVAGLRGRVLDVGCGEQLYRDTLVPLVRAGAVDYTGLDPDEPSLAILRDALPEGRFHVTGIEAFHGQPASYDHILCLRSLNHVFDVDEALARMRGLLKPGGRLLIVETAPFAMLRRPEQVAAADQAPRAGHQHFRNVTSEDVLPFVRRRALRIVEHQAASLQTTNEWILLLERPS
jgi:SAM-dependent methyltransferase